MATEKKSPLAQERENRAAAAMRENLRRRKQQQQARSGKERDSVNPDKET